MPHWQGNHQFPLFKGDLGAVKALVQIHMKELARLMSSLFLCSLLFSIQLDQM